MFGEYQDEVFEVLGLIAAFVPSYFRGIYQVIVAGLQAGVRYDSEKQALWKPPPKEPHCCEHDDKD